MRSNRAWTRCFLFATAFACAPALLPLGACPRARAEEPAPRKLRLLAAVGYAPQDDSDAGSYGVAFGLKAGYVLASWVHVGAEGTFHVGTRFGDEQNRVQYYGLELGAHFERSRVGVTPYLTGGIASVETERNVDPAVTSAYLGLGAMIDLTLNEWLLFGLDLRVVELTSSVRQGDNQGGSMAGEFLLLAGARF